MKERTGEGKAEVRKIILSSSCHTVLMIIKEPDVFPWLCPLLEARRGEGNDIY